MRGDTHISVTAQRRRRTILAQLLREEVLRQLLRLWLCGALTALVTISVDTSHAWAQAAKETPRAVIIFDGSGSMWGRLGKSTKFDVASKEIATILPSYDTQIAMGLIVYGHRRKGDCNDIQILAAPAPGQAGYLTDTIKGISPRGKTPIASSLESAASLLANLSSGHIIVLTDGVENCRTDLCETVDAVRNASPGLIINAIGLGLRDKDVARIQCLSKGGGGRLVVANNADAMRKGLLNILDDIASGVRFTPEEDSAAPVRAIPPKVVLGPPLLQLRALYTDNGPLIDAPVVWRVIPIGSQSLEPVYAREANGPDVDVLPGKYRIEAQIGNATATRDVVMPGRGKRSVHLPLNVARLDIRTHMPLTRGETITMLQTSAASQKTVPPILITNTTGSGERFYLPPGAYTIRRDSNATSETRSVTLQAGNESVLSFDRALATIKATARLAPDSREPVPNIIYKLERQSGESTGTWSEVTRSAAPEPKFAVTEGTYRITTLTGLLHETVSGSGTIEKIVTVQAGKTANVVLYLQAGTIRLNAVNLSNGSLPQPVRYQLTAIRSDPANPKTIPVMTASSRAILTVPAGFYRVDAFAGETNLKATTEVILNAGADERVDLSFNPARLKISIATADGSRALRSVMWDIQSLSAGKPGVSVWSSEGRSQELALAPGRYVVIATDNGREKRKEIVLAGGQSMDIALPSP